MGRGRLGWRENNFTLIHKPGPATAWVRVLFNLLLVVLAGVFLLIKDVLGRHLALINFLHQSAALECQMKASSGPVYNGVGEPRQHPPQLRKIFQITFLSCECSWRMCWLTSTNASHIDHHPLFTNTPLRSYQHPDARSGTFACLGSAQERDKLIFFTIVVLSYPLAPLERKSEGLFICENLCALWF